jgi:hypothetical protein
MNGIKHIVNWGITHELIDDIVIWNNDVDTNLQKLLPYNNKVSIINSDSNIMCYGRWLAASKCKHDHVYVQDDDFKPGDLNKLYQLYIESECDIVSYCAPSHKINKPAMRFVGFGSIINKACISVTIDKYIDKFNEDFLLYRESDLLITNMNTYEKHVTDLDTIDNSTHDMNAMWRQSNHYKFHGEMIERCKILMNE